MSETSTLEIVQRVMKFLLSNQLPLFFMLVVLLMVTRLYGLVRLPVFADEAIYIRRSQLMLGDMGRYWFFPMLDGKTPLQHWMQLPFLALITDQLWAARFFSALSTVPTVIGLWWFARILKLPRWIWVAGCVLVALSPFWLFHQRTALLEGWAAAFVWLSFVTLLSAEKKTQHWIYSLSGFLFGLALMTKLNYVLAAPALGVLFATHYFPRWKQALSPLLLLSLGAGAALLPLLFSPVVGALISRGSDFLSLSDILAGRWKDTVPNIPTYLSYFVAYLGAIPLTLAFLSPLHPRKSLVAPLLIGALSTFLPVAVMGRVVYPRYFFPSVVFFTPLVMLSLQVISEWISHQPKLRQPLLRSLGSVFLLACLSNWLLFAYPLLTNPDSTPFVLADRGQYLTDWSSGHGVRESVSTLRALALIEPLAVATEGRFGTLPDGPLLEMFNNPIADLYLEGVGYPLDRVPDWFWEKAVSYPKVLLLANSDRILFDLQESVLIEEYCRPYNGTCLKLYDITLLRPTQ